MERDPANKAKIFGVISVMAWFGLALFWSVDKSFRWIFFGVAIAVGFIYLLKSGAFDFKSSDFFQPRRGSQRNFPSASTLTASEKGALYFGVGTIVALILAFVFYAVSTGFETQKDEVQPVEIISETTTALLNNPDDVLEQGNNFFNNSEFDSAMVCYNRALSLRPGFKEAYFNIALIYSSQSDYSNAILTLEKCLQSHSDYGEALQLMGNCYSRQERQDEALPFFERAYATGTRNAELSHYLGYLYDLKENTPRAIEFYKEAIQQDSSKVDVYKRLAELEPEKSEWYTKKAEQWAGNN
ncbi:MAG: tetratricopeptide repeat protein [Bacteroidia bacterium]|nr:tetratricopeptide repeat protein [Bacteroidia bacterium]